MCRIRYFHRLRVPGAKLTVTTIQELMAASAQAESAAADVRAAEQASEAAVRQQLQDAAAAIAADADQRTSTEVV